MDGRRTCRPRLLRPGIGGLDRGFVINIDHHPGNTMYGALNWFDLSAAACGEMVFELVRELGVPLTHPIAVHVYLAILTDTGAFHYSSISPRTFDICRQCMEAGVDPPAVARSIFDSNNLGRLKLFGAVPSSARVERDGNVISGGGVTAGIDFALALIAELHGEETAQMIQLYLEYAPAPPFEGGTPELAPPHIYARVQAQMAESLQRRRALVAQIAQG